VALRREGAPQARCQIWSSCRAWFPGSAGRSSAIPARPSGSRRSAGARPGHRAFFLGTRIEEAQKRPLPASGGAGVAPPAPQNHRPASWRLTLPWASPRGRAGPHRMCSGVGGHGARAAVVPGQRPPRVDEAHSVKSFAGESSRDTSRKVYMKFLFSTRLGVVASKGGGGGREWRLIAKAPVHLARVICTWPLLSPRERGARVFVSYTQKLRACG
jgi:hypothetical protein